ncbi:hypothetical protein BV22DRAFT_717230 [Leucogyrophana mollusca]|uniref:Uncharacterized protein n=1 Tax=Leucogyrophana mollusca TaxID=85980 RepID=A0ACB8B9P5_9AGAM|nr:hypothetical protein BV22DRAFT_717230 [Leucogyrophana mollusca]
MSDSFADLWNSSAPTTSKPNPQPQKLGLPQQIPRRPQQKDVFSLLSASQPTSRTGSPHISSPAQPRSAHPAVSAANPPTRSNGDAFSELFSGSSAMGSGRSMTIAERAAMVEKSRLQQHQSQPKSSQTQPSAWDGIDMLAQSTTSPPIPPTNASASSSQDDPDFAFSSAPASKHVPPPAGDDDWGLADFSSPQSASTSAPTAKPPASKSPQTLWELDEFASAPISPAKPPSKSPPQVQSDDTFDFDFGNREDGLLDEQSDDEDVLGDLGKPVHASASSRVSSNTNTGHTTPSPPASTHARPVSPPPHIVGQIVEMGFSPQQARVALAATKTGLDVQAALETLLANGAGVDTESSEPIPAPAPPQRRRPAASRTSSAPTAASTSADPAAQAAGVQAEKIIAQASEIGLSVFNRANAFWKESKEKAQRLYEERAAAAARSEGATGGGPRDGRPRWMQDNGGEGASRGRDEGGGEGALRNRKGKDVGFSDDVLPPKPPRRAHPEPAPREARTADLLSTDAPTAYVSPFRHGRPKPDSQPAPTPRAPSPIRLATRQTVSASPSALAASAKHKSLGTEKYKLGQYADAESAYAAAISALPDSHLLRVPLYNNRALTRLKIGNYAAAAEDCTAAIDIVGASYHPAREAPVVREEDGAGVDLGEGLAKAWRRRAEAHEGRERWELARADWEAVAGAEWVAPNVRGEAVRGAGRCRRMLDGSSSSASASTAPPTAPRAPAAKPRPRPRNPVAAPPTTDALNALREATNAAEAEDLERHALKDAVDARLLAWKGGKETNIRALIASLDTVLWEGLGWQKVGMAELVGAGQVKVRYMRAIGRLHPDKLNAKNTTLEQRMIANGVFGTLNEAWNAFQQQ